MTGLPENTLRFWRHQGTGPKSARLGRRIVYRERDVTDWIDQQFSQLASPIGQSGDGSSIARGRMTGRFVPRAAVLGHSPAPSGASAQNDSPL